MGRVNKEGDKIFACISSIPQRSHLLVKTIGSIVNQVDEVYLYLNDYSIKSAKKLRDISPDKICFVIGDNKLGDAHKFHWADKLKGFIFTLDDDLIYPPDYVEKVVAGIEKYNRLAVITFHGRLLKFPITDYATSHVWFVTFKDELHTDLFAHTGGTGCMGWHSSTIKPTMNDFPSPNMADTHFAILAQKKKIPICILAHKSNWITEMYSGDSIAIMRTEKGYSEHKSRVSEVGEWKLYGVRLREETPENPPISPVKNNGSNKYSAIVLNWNESHISIQTVENLLKENIDVIVVDNGSMDGSGDKFKEKFGNKIKLVLLNKNYGSSIARNIGIDLIPSGNKFTFLIDGDILYVPNTISEYERVINKFDNCACVGYFDWELRKDGNLSHGTQHKELADKAMDKIKKIGTWYPIAWTQYGLFRTEVLKKYRFVSTPPFDMCGYGFEDDWLYKEFSKDGWTSLSVDAPYYYHDAHYSLREMQKMNASAMFEERREAFNSKWGEKVNSKELYNSVKDKAYIEHEE